MTTALPSWTIYEVTAGASPIVNVKFRGRLRKFAIQNNISLLTENASDRSGAVRFALNTNESLVDITSFIETMSPGAHVECVLQNIHNPVLSKLVVNDLNRYKT